MLNLIFRRVFKYCKNYKKYCKKKKFEYMKYEFGKKSAEFMRIIQEKSFA